MKQGALLLRDTSPQTRPDGGGPSAINSFMKNVFIACTPDFPPSIYNILQYVLVAFTPVSPLLSPPLSPCLSSARGVPQGSRPVQPDGHQAAPRSATGRTARLWQGEERRVHDRMLPTHPHACPPVHPPTHPILLRCTHVALPIADGHQAAPRSATGRTARLWQGEERRVHD